MGERAVIAVRGDHDIATVEALAVELAQAIGCAEADVLVDLSEVRFMDASTVRVILRAREHLERHEHTLTLRSPPTFVQRIIEVCGLGDLVEPRSGSEAAAL